MTKEPVAHAQVRMTPALKAEVKEAAHSLGIPVTLFMQKAAQYLVAAVKRGDPIELRAGQPVEGE